MAAKKAVVRCDFINKERTKGTFCSIKIGKGKKIKVEDIIFKEVGGK